MEQKHYFCNDCGTKFVSGRDDPPCPECGSWDTYPDTEQGYDAAFETFQRYDAERYGSCDSHRDCTFNGCPIVTADDGNTYAIDGSSWNGEEYRRCWIVKKSGGGWIWDLKAPTVALRPVERWQAEGLSLDEIEENSPEWNAACERVAYEICY